MLVSGRPTGAASFGLGFGAAAVPAVHGVPARAYWNRRNTFQSIVCIFSGSSYVMFEGRVYLRRGRGKYLYTMLWNVFHLFHPAT